MIEMKSWRQTVKEWKENNLKDAIMKYLKDHPSPFERNQKTILRALNVSQATFNAYVGILIGEGKVTVQKFAMTKIYSIKEE